MASSVIQEKAREQDHRQMPQSGTVLRLQETLWLRNQNPETSKKMSTPTVTFWLASLYLWFKMCQNRADFQIQRILKLEEAKEKLKFGGI